MMSAGMAKIIVMMVAIMSVAESIPTLTPMDHALPDAHTTTTHARHGHLLHGMLGDLESYVFDDVVEFMFHHLGEELPQARSRPNYRQPHDYYEDGDSYPVPSQYYTPEPKDQSCISTPGYSDSSIFCLNIFTALSVAGVALLLQFLFFACVSNLCPTTVTTSSSSSSGGGSSSLNNFFAVNSSNDVSVEQNDYIDIDITGTGRSARAYLINQADGESELEVDTNLGEDGEDGGWNVLLRKRKGKQIQEETEGKPLNQHDKEGDMKFTMNILQESVMGRLLNNWGLVNNPSICNKLGRYMQR